MLQIIDLKHKPQYLEQLAHWHQHQWQHLNPGETLGKRIVRMQAYLDNRLIPSTYIALRNNTLLGSAALVDNDMETHTELGPWIASVYVDSMHRQQGIGSRLVLHVMQQAQQSGIRQLFLFTPDRQSFYTRIGWQIYGREHYHGEPVTLMQWVFPQLAEKSG